MTPTVTIGIPTYNRSRLLSEAIQSVQRQTYQDFEIVVSDDCSVDDTEDVVRGFQDPRIRYARTPENLRPPRNWNVCIRLAQGKFFSLLPDDDLYAPDYLKEMVKALEAHPEVGFAQCGFYQVDQQLRYLQSLCPHPTSLVLAGEAALTWQLERLACLPVTVLFRRKTMLQMGLWREDYWDDWAFIIRTAYRHGFTFVPKRLAYNRVHDSNLNRHLVSEGRDTVLDLINQQTDVFAEALPTTDRLIAFRAHLNRQASQHAVLLGLGAFLRGEWPKAFFQLNRARQLYAFAWLDPAPFQLWLTIRAEIRRERKRRAAAQATHPLIQF